MATRPRPKLPPPPPPAAVTLQSMRADIERRLGALRSEIEQLRAALDLTTEGSLPLLEYAQRIESYVKGQAARFEATIEYSLSGLRLPTAETPHFGQAAVHGGGMSPEVVASADLSGMACWLFKDQLAERLIEVVSKAGYTPGPPLADRARLRNQLVAQLAELGHAEEAIIVEAEALNFEVARRLDSDPAVVLSLWHAATPKEPQEADV